MIINIVTISILLGIIGFFEYQVWLAFLSWFGEYAVQVEIVYHLVILALLPWGAGKAYSMMNKLVE